MIGLTELLSQLPGAQTVGQLPATVRRVHTDSRSLQAGDLFVALRGDRFDAHGFLRQAAHAGAVAAVAEQGLAEAGLPGVEVPDTRRALGQLSALWRWQYRLPLIGVTGSNGKTTVTQMIAAILRAAVGDDALATQGNLNNDIGVPLTLLRLRDHHRLAVVELGMNHPGEIAVLAAMAAPSVGLVNNAQREHQEYMGTVEAVARENGDVIATLGRDGVAVFPAHDTYTPLWTDLARGRRSITFGGDGPNGGADVGATATWRGDAWELTLHTPLGDADVRLHIAGRHNVRNAQAACACALAAGVALADVVKGLNAFEPVQGRSRAMLLSLHHARLTLVDDTYNANPDSVRAAVDVLAELPAPRVLVLGDMGEVGDQGLVFHDEVLRYALAQGVDQVLCTGRELAVVCADWAQQHPQLAAQGQVRHWADATELQAHAAEASMRAASMLVKGSRFMKMEGVVQAVQRAWVQADTTTATGGAHAS